MAQPVSLPPRPNPYRLQSCGNASARKSNVARPQQSPATPAHRAPGRRHTSNTPHYASATATTTSRKRARPDSHAQKGSRASLATPQSDLGSTWTLPSLDSSAVRRDFASPEPFVNTKYNLAGGLDTPGVTRETYFEREAQDDLGVRRRWRDSSDAQDDQMSENRLRQHPSSTNGSPELRSWGQFMFAVAGRVWQFGTSAFKGFYAGGGKGYAMEAPIQEAQTKPDSSMWESMQESSSLRFGRDATPVPGSFPIGDDDEVEYGQRPSKRMHVEGGESPWVLVQNPIDEELQRKKTLHRPPPPTRSTTTTRRSLVPVSRRTSYYPNSAGSPAVHHPQRSAPYVHQRSPSDVTPVAKQSPLSPEAEKYLAERRKEEKQQDASIRRMNEQLKALLKQGRQALGTKVEVFMDEDGMDVEDEGYFEDGR